MGSTQPPTTLEEKNEALRFAEQSGVPFSQALLVVKGTVSLTDVVKEMKARRRRDGLIAEGLPPSLAGQVARGRLPATRARTIKNLWDAQKAPLPIGPPREPRGRQAPGRVIVRAWRGGRHGFEGDAL